MISAKKRSIAVIGFGLPFVVLIGLSASGMSRTRFAFAASVGTLNLQSAIGNHHSALRTPHSALLQTRVVRVVNATAQRGQQVSVTIESDAQGDENAYGFSMNFDPLQLVFVDAMLGPDASTGIINVNNSQAAQGRAGVALALPTGQSIAAGTKKIVTVIFTVPANSTADSLTINFGDQPILREVVNPNAEVLAATWTQGTVTIGRPVVSVSAASFLGDELAPESIVAAFGTGLATTTQAATVIPLPAELAGTTVRVLDKDGTARLASLFFVSPAQINFLLPSGTALGTATVTITSGDGTISVGSIKVATVAPALFSANSRGQGVAAATVLRAKADGTQLFEPVATFDTALNDFIPIPIELGPQGEEVFLIAFGSGFRSRRSLSAVEVKIGGVSAEVLFAGIQGDFVGLDQCNIRIPRSLVGRGVVEVMMTVDGKPANTVRISVH